MGRHIRVLARDCVAVLLGFMIAVASPFAVSAGRATPSDGPRPNNVFGMWTTEDGNGVIAIEQCGEGLCGRIVGIGRSPGEPIPKDVHGDSQCGLVITRQKPTGDGSWNGEITDPRSGTKYGAQLWLDKVGNLRLRGYLGLPILGQTQTWRPFTGRVTQACEFA